MAASAFAIGDYDISVMRRAILIMYVASGVAGWWGNPAAIRDSFSRLGWLLRLAAILAYE
jgi:hypothetical protein